MLRVYISTNKVFHNLIISAGIIFFLYGCGGGGGGDSESSSPSEEIVLELGLDGPGDEGGYFPLEVGNLWVFEGTTSSTEGSFDYNNAISINETRNIDGYNSLVIEETNSYGEGPFESYIFKDYNGIANLGSSDNNSLGIEVSKYWEGRFPLIAGESFVQLDRTGLDSGKDLDGDGTNELFDIRSVVTVISFTRKTVPVGTFNDVAHIRRELTLDIFLSSGAKNISGTSQEDSYFAADIGFIERSLSITIDGSTESALEQLVAYSVNGEVAGINRVTDSVLGGVGDPLGGNTYYWFDVVPNTEQTVSITGLTGDVDLLPVLPSICTQDHTSLLNTNPEDCQIAISSYRVVMAVSDLGGSEYILSIAPTPNVAIPVSEGQSTSPISIQNNLLTEGQVGPGGISYYSSTNLQFGKHTVSISGLNADADLGVYSDGTYSIELDCTFIKEEDVDNYPEDCSVENVDELHFVVRSGEFNNDGASFIVLVR